MKKLIFLLISLGFFFIPGYTIAATHDIHIEWTFDFQPEDGRTLAGYYLYKEGVKVCTNTTPTDRAMDCTFDSDDGTFEFTLTAFCTDGFESPHSSPYSFTLTTPSTPILLAAFTTTPTTLSGDIPFPVSFDATTSTGEIASYSWDFGDNTFGTGSQITHTYTTTGTYNATLTVKGTNNSISQKSIVLYVTETAQQPPLSTHDIHIEWTYDYQPDDGRTLAGYYLYKEGTKICTNTTPTDRSMDCTFQSEDGTFDFTLTAFCSDGYESPHSSPYSFTVTTSSEPELAALFDTIPTSISGDYPFQVSFDASPSTGDIASYDWTFGDNSTSNTKQTTHTYITAGNYNAILTVTSSTGATSKKSVPVTITAPPVAAIITTPITLTGQTPFTVSFDASASSGNITSYTWSFADGTTGSGLTTTHTYTTAGTFNATLIVSNTNGTTDQTSVTVITTTPPVPPIAVIIPTTFSGDVPLTVSFDGSSSTSAASYAWVFGDGSTASVNPTSHTFTTAGTYTTTLTVTDTLGQKHSTNATITVKEVAAENTPPTAIIISSTAMGDAPLSILFDGSMSEDTDGSVSSHLWNFGDGSQAATEEKVTHTYTVAGTYYPSLTVTDNQGATNTTSTPVMITGQTEENLPPTAQITPSITNGAIPLEVVFDGSASTDPEGATLTYNWNFGDGASEQGIKPTHIYTSPGSFTATLTVTDDYGATSNTTTTINVTEGTPEFQIELGEVDIDHNWMRIEFSDPFINPVVVAGPPSKNDSTPCVVRLRNISSTGFDIRIQEWTYLDGNHAKETVAYFVMEQGNFTLDDGTLVEAGQFTSNDTNFKTVQFNTAFTVEPVVMTSIATFNEEDTVTGRLQNISTTAFEHKTQEQQLANGHGSEIVNYIAWEPSQNSIDGINVIVNKTADKVRNRWYIVDYGEQLTDIPIFLGTMQSQDGIDPSAIRYTNKTNNEIQVMVEEEQSLDDETRHTSEIVGYFLFSATSIEPTNQAPIAVITADTTEGLAPLSVSFDGGNSTDADGSIVTYQWNFGDGNTSTGITTSYVFSEAGIHPIYLSVTDDKGATSQNELTITIQESDSTGIEISDDFEGDTLNNYTTFSGTLSIEGGLLHGSSWEKTMAFHNTSLESDNQVVEADVYYSGTAADGGGLLIRVNKTNHTGYVAYFYNGLIYLKSFQGSVLSSIINGTSVYQPGTYKLKMISNGNNIQVFIDNEQVINLANDTFSEGNFAGLSIFRTKANQDGTIDNFQAYQNVQ